LFQGPRGWDYWNRLENAKDYQNPNLWPDKRPTYFVGEMVMPAGSSLTIRGRFPRARYFKFAVYKFERSTFVALGGEDLAAFDLEPDPGSSNAYTVGADRTLENRNFTIVVRAEDAPKTGPRTRSARTVSHGWTGAREGLDDPRDRKDGGMLLMRFMVCHPDWENSPAKARKPGMEEAVMGPYYPRGYYTTKAEFESKGVKKCDALDRANTRKDQL
jgi:hypothetical protein